MTRWVSHEQTHDRAGLSHQRAHDQAGLSPTDSRPGGSLIDGLTTGRVSYRRNDDQAGLSWTDSRPGGFLIIERWEQGGASLVVWVRVAVKFALFRRDRDMKSTRWWRCPEMRLSAVTRLVWLFVSEFVHVCLCVFVCCIVLVWFLWCCASLLMFSSVGSMSLLRSNY